MDFFHARNKGTASGDRRVVILDDDPTGTQTVSEVRVILRPSANAYRAFFCSEERCVYILTNSRALPQRQAVELLRRIKRDVDRAAEESGHSVAYILRGDSTLRGHVFAEMNEFAVPESAALFVPAFPECGRVTRGGVHWLFQGDEFVPVARTEFARDPVFGYRSEGLTDWVAEVGGGWQGVSIPLDKLRQEGPSAVASSLTEAGPRTVVIPDAENSDDLAIIAEGLRGAEKAGRPVVVRSAASFAAAAAGLVAHPILEPLPGAGPVLIVCGSHTQASTRQLQRLSEVCPADPVYLDVSALTGAKAPDLVNEAVMQLKQSLRDHCIAIVATERKLQAGADYTTNGEKIMSTLCEIVSQLSGECAAVISKGGITSANVAVKGLSASEAWVKGQLEPGISLWELLSDSGRRIPYAVIPGNVGNDDSLAHAARMFSAIPG